jgi:hypothetical protein
VVPLLQVLLFVEREEEALLRHYLKRCVGMIIFG